MLVISRHDGASYVGAPGAVAGREGRHLETLPDVHCELAASGGGVLLLFITTEKSVCLSYTKFMRLSIKQAEVVRERTHTVKFVS